MSRDIKEMSKELVGKSFNSYHRKTRLPQIEKNNIIKLLKFFFHK